jgi:hypothetical protein
MLIEQRVHLSVPHPVSGRQWGQRMRLMGNSCKIMKGTGNLGDRGGRMELTRIVRIKFKLLRVRTPIVWPAYDRVLCGNFLECDNGLLRVSERQLDSLDDICVVRESNKLCMYCSPHSFHSRNLVCVSVFAIAVLLGAFRPSVFPSACPYEWRNCRIERMFVKSDGSEFYETLSAGPDKKKKKSRAIPGTGCGGL